MLLSLPSWSWVLVYGMMCCAGRMKGMTRVGIMMSLARDIHVSPPLKVPQLVIGHD